MPINVPMPTPYNEVPEFGFKLPIPGSKQLRSFYSVMDVLVHFLANFLRRDLRLEPLTTVVLPGVPDCWEMFSEYIQFDTEIGGITYPKGSTRYVNSTRRCVAMHCKLQRDENQGYKPRYVRYSNIDVWVVYVPNGHPSMDLVIRVRINDAVINIPTSPNADDAYPENVREQRFHRKALVQCARDAIVPALMDVILPPTS